MKNFERFKKILYVYNVFLCNSTISIQVRAWLLIISKNCIFQDVSESRPNERARNNTYSFSHAIINLKKAEQYNMNMTNIIIMNKIMMFLVQSSSLAVMRNYS